MGSCTGGIPLYYGKSPLHRRQKLKGEIKRTKRTRTSQAIRKQKLLNREKARSHRPPDTIDSLIPKMHRNRLHKRERFERSSPLTFPGTPPADSACGPEKITTPDNRQRRRPLVVHPDLLFVPPDTAASESEYATPNSTPVPNQPPQPLTRVTSVHRPNASIILKSFQMVDDDGHSMLLVSSAMKTLVGLCWLKNSCWLDSLLEVLFWVETRDFLPISNFLTNQLPFTPILACLDERRRLLLSNSPPELISDRLLASKTELRQYIVQNKWTTSQLDDSFKNDVSWLVEALSSTRKSGDHQISNHYGLHTVVFKWCTGDDLALLSQSDTTGSIHFAHAMVGNIDRSRPILRIPSSKYEMCKGSVATYLQRYTTDFIVHSQEMGAIPCWHAHEGDVWCPGVCMSSKAIVSLPQTLIARVERENLDEEWDFPLSLRPVLEKEAQDAGLEYELVGRIFYGRSHFVARFVAVTDTPKRAKSVFFYDGMGVRGGDAGYSVKESGGVAKNLGGWNIPMPAGYSGFQTATVVYRLRGGKKAQMWFWERQRHLLQSKIGIKLNESYTEELQSQPTLERKGFKRLPPERMPWLHKSSRVRPQPYLEYIKSDVLPEPLYHQV